MAQVHLPDLIGSRADSACRCQPPPLGAVFFIRPKVQLRDVAHRCNLCNDAKVITFALRALSCHVQQLAARPPSRSTCFAPSLQGPGCFAAWSLSVRGTMDQEKRTHYSQLWDRIASSVSNGWAITNQALGSESVVSKLTKYPVRIYAVHMATGWMAAGSTTIEMMIKAREIALQERRDGTLISTLDRITLEIDECAKLDVDGSDQRCNSAIARTALALASTRTYELAAERSLAGHWLLLVYRSQTDVLMHRPAFLAAGHQQVGLMSPGDVLTMAKLTSDIDLKPGSSIYEGLKEAGGPVLAEIFSGVEVGRA